MNESSESAKSRSSNGAETFLPQRCLAVEHQELHSAAKILIEALTEYVCAADSYEHSNPMISLPGHVHLARRLASSVAPEIADLFDAIFEAESNPTVASTNSGGYAWTPPLTPRQLRYLIARAESTDEEANPLSEQANLNLKSWRRFEARRTATYCDRSEACRLRVVTWPGRNHGPACWRHLTESERTILTELYEKTMILVACKTCAADFGEFCFQDQSNLRTVGGFRSPARTFNKCTLHLSRIDDFADRYLDQGPRN